MKKLAIVFGILLMIFTSCKKDNETKPEVPESERTEVQQLSNYNFVDNTHWTTSIGWSYGNHFLLATNTIGSAYQYYRSPTGHYKVKVTVTQITGSFDIMLEDVNIIHITSPGTYEKETYVIKFLTPQVGGFIALYPDRTASAKFTSVELFYLNY